MTPSLWVAIVFMLLGAVSLVAGVGASALWVAMIAVGIAIVVIDLTRRRKSAAA